MFRIGASLREARTRRGLSQADVQQAIRIRERYLTAIEEERWEQLPGEAYAKGFLRTYAEYLGLDGDLYVDEWNSRFAHPDETAAVPEPAPAARRRIGLLRPLAVAVVVAVVVAAVAAWQLGGGGRRAPTAAPPTTTRAATSPPPRHTRPAPPAPVYAVFRGTRGRCWLLVRSGGTTGPVVYEQVLALGATLRLAVARGLWVRLGAPWNVDLTVGGRALPGLPTAPGNILVSRSGIAPAA